MARRTDRTTRKSVEALTHGEATRRNIPTAEHRSVMPKKEQAPVPVAYERRNRDLDPQLVWRGKDEQNLSDLVVDAPPLYIQENVHPKALIEDLKKRPQTDEQATEGQPDLFADFNGLPKGNARTKFYRHDAKWSNRMILGDSLQVMASLAEREGLRGQVQCIYLDPPYGIKFNSNFQWSTTSRNVKDGNAKHITREPEQVKAFRDTWRDGIHSYLTYLRDRLIVARDLLADTGSIFVQIGEENVHRVRTVMDEVFGEDNFVSMVTFRTHSALGVKYIATPYDYILWFCRDIDRFKYRDLFLDKLSGAGTQYKLVQELDGARRSMSKDESSGRSKIDKDSRVFRLINLPSSGYTPSCTFDFEFEGRLYPPSNGHSWKTTRHGMDRLVKASRVYSSGTYLNFVLFHDDFAAMRLTGAWDDTYAELDRKYVVQTSIIPIQRCILMASDPGDLVLDPTCGSGTTAYVAEQWGRRWITIDTSRVALALARARIMGARYPYYLLADSAQGQAKEAELTHSVPSDQATHGDIRHGFVYQRVPHITLKSIANNTEIDVIWDRFQETLEPLRQKLNKTLKKKWKDWEISREQKRNWSPRAKRIHKKWWEERIARQNKIDASIAAKADFEYLYDKPYENTHITRVTGPFTVESLSPHRVLGVDEDDELIDSVAESRARYGGVVDFADMILENLRTAGVQQVHKEDKIAFTSLTPWPGDLICAEGRYIENGAVGGGGGG